MLGTWRTELKVNGDGLFKVPPSIPLELLSTLFVSPATALRLISDFGNLKHGDWIIQNGANSLVGQAVIVLSQYMGFNTINVVREGLRSEQEMDQLLSTLHALGGDINLSDVMLKEKVFQDGVVGDLPPIKLALNCTGGDMGEGIALALGEGGEFVTYGGMSKKPVKIPAASGKNLSFKGFWMTDWYGTHGDGGREGMLEVFQDLIVNHQRGWFTKNFHFEDFNTAYLHSSKVSILLFVS